MPTKNEDRKPPIDIYIDLTEDEPEGTQTAAEICSMQKEYPEVAMDPPTTAINLCDNVSQNDPSNLSPAPIASVASEDDASLTSHFLASTKPLKAPDEMSSRLHL